MPILSRRRPVGCFLILLMLSLPCLESSRVSEDNPQLKEAYRDADFSRIIVQLENQELQSLSLGDRLLYIECLARKGQGTSLETQILQLSADFPQSDEVHAVAGIWYSSQGRLLEAEDLIKRALVINPTSLRAQLARVMLLLHVRRFQDAKEAYEDLLAGHREWSGSRFSYLMGLDIYRADRDFQKLCLLYQSRSETISPSERQRAKDLKENYKFYKRLRNKPIFQTESKASSSSLAFAPNSKKVPPNTISLVIKNKTFNVLLDTGNTAGWVVHNRELADLLKLKRGTRVLTKIGTEAELMEGYHIYTKKVGFGEFSLNHLIGLYVPKPHPDFYDANLNPAFIRDRIITLDFIQRRLLLRTRLKFDEDLAFLEGKSAEKFPWQGYRYVFIPVETEGKKSLALLETGAADVSLKLAFAEQLGLELQPRSRYLADGTRYSFFEAGVRVQAGSALFIRKHAEVWPLAQFSHRLTGLSPQVVIGPQALADFYALSFDPFRNQIILLRE